MSVDLPVFAWVLTGKRRIAPSLLTVKPTEMIFPETMLFINWKIVFGTLGKPETHRYHHRN
jgi:hypothetical protein